MVTETEWIMLQLELINIEQHVVKVFWLIWRSVCVRSKCVVKCGRESDG